MTQAVANTLNNLDQILSNQSGVQKVTETASSAMDKAKDFTKVFESTLNKETSAVNKVNNPTNPSEESTLQKESFTIEDVKIGISQKAVEITDDNIVSVEFKEILDKATDEANVETSLDLTLARDIKEIISQLKEAVENATEIIEEGSEEDVTVIDELVNTEEDLDIELESSEETFAQEVDKQEQKVPFEQVLAFVDKTLAADVDRQVLQNEKESLKTLSEQVELTTEEVVEFAENLVDEVVSLKTTEETNSGDFELALDEEVLKELKIETISADTEPSSGNDLMQNQSPEEYAVKAMINQEIEPFEVKIDSVQSIQNHQQVQAKPVDVNPSRIIDQITKHLEGLQNNSKVSIVLNPEALGKVNIQLMSTKEGLTAQFTVMTQEARDMLTKGLDGLKEALGTHGVSVDNVSVKVADSQKSEYKQDWTEQEGSRGGNKGQGQPNREEKEKGLFEKMMAQTTENENGNV